MQAKASYYGGLSHLIGFSHPLPLSGHCAAAPRCRLWRRRHGSSGRLSPRSQAADVGRGRKLARGGLRMMGEGEPPPHLARPRPAPPPAMVAAPRR